MTLGRSVCACVAREGGSVASEIGFSHCIGVLGKSAQTSQRASIAGSSCELLSLGGVNVNIFQRQ